MLPLVFSAANAFSVEYTATTPELTLPGVVPPLFESPHAMTLPSVFNAANAKAVEYTTLTPEFAAVTLLGAVPP
jgi:hypothetical protein